MGEDRPDAVPGEQPGGGRGRGLSASAGRQWLVRPARRRAGLPPATAHGVSRRSGPSSADRPAAPRCSLRCRASACHRPTGMRPPPVDERTARSFGPTTPGAGAEGFEAPLGSRIWPTLHKAQSPWWKPDAARDPWRDPASPFWLGRPAIFTSDGLQQLSPDVDTEHADQEVTGTGAGEDEGPRGVGRGRFGLSAAAADVDRWAAGRSCGRQRRLVAGRAIQPSADQRRCDARHGGIAGKPSTGVGG